MLKYGPHTSRTDFENGSVKYPCCQIYLAGSMRSSWKPLNVPKLPYNHNFFIHTPLNVNMGFEGNNYMSGIISKCCSEVEGVAGSCVLHIGKCKGKKRAECCDMSEGSSAREVLNLIAERINKIKIPDSKNKRTLLLENAAGRNGELGNSWDDIRLLFEALDNTGKIGLCLDTQHSFSAGLCSFKSGDIVNNWLDEAEEISPVCLIHLNDSTIKYKGYNDSHESLGDGYIWRDSFKSLEALLVRCINDDRPLVCETDDFEQDNQLVTELLEEADIDVNLGKNKLM